MDSCDWKEKPMKSVRISSHLRQYPRKDCELQRPCVMTTQGSTLSRSRCVVPPIRNPCPLTEVRPSWAQASLHRSRNHFLFIGAHEPSDVSNAKRGVVDGIIELDDRWCLKAAIELQSQVESDKLIFAPFSLVFVWGMVKLTYFVPLAAIPLVMSVEHVT